MPLTLDVDKAVALLRNEQKWMEEHGGTLAGYIKQYGSKHDAHYYGEGGEAIYAADLAAVEKAEDVALAAIVHAARKSR